MSLNPEAFYYKNVLGQQPPAIYKRGSDLAPISTNPRDFASL